MSSKVIDSVFLVLLAIQVGVQPLVAQKYVDIGINGASLVLGAEIFKLISCSTLLYISDMGITLELEYSKWNLRSSVLGAGLPAFVYAIQNSLIWIAYSHLTGIMFNLINQTKTMFTALFVFLLLGKRQSLLQIFSLIMLLIAAVVLTTGEQFEDDKDNSFVNGILPLVIASALSGFASALCQLTLQGKSQRNSFVFSIELAIYSSIVIVFSILLGKMYDASNPGLAKLFTGWKLYTVIPVFLQGTGGIIIGQVTKRSGGVLKGFSVCSGLILTAVLESLFGISQLQAKHFIGLILVISSLYIYNSPFAKPLIIEKDKAI